MKNTFLFLAIAVFIWSGVQPHDRLTWWLETLPAFFGVTVLIYFDRKKAVTPLVFILVCLHAVILCVGGKYTYAEVPFGFWLQEIFSGTRNNYDKIGHFMQGFVPAMIAREVFIRHHVIPKKGFWLALFIVSVCLAFSAFYELIEWGVALISDQAAESFLGTQGYIWDTQSDMFWALIGALTALVTLSKWHDRQVP